MTHPSSPPQHLRRSLEFSRRTFLTGSAASIGAAALGSLLHARAASPHHTPKAKRVLFLFMAGGPSHVDLFDPKPKLNQLDGQKIPAELLKDHQQFALIRGTPSLKGSNRIFSHHGRSGIVLHLMGIHHEHLTFRTQGRDFRLTDVAGSVIQPLLA